MRDYLIFAVIIGSLPIIFFRPHIGVLVWSWISYMNPHRLTYGMAYDFPVAAFVGSALLLGLVFAREPKRIPWTPLTIAWLLLVLWMSLSTTFALIPDGAVEGWKKMIKIQLITFVTLMLMRSRERITLLVAVIVASLGFYGIKGGVFALLTGGDYKVFGPPGSFIGDNNALALALVMTLPLAYYLQLQMQHRLVKLALWGIMGLSVLSIIASYSRGAFLAMSAMIVVMIMKTPRRGQILLVLLIGVPLFASFVPERWYDRMSTIGSYEQDASALGRINAWWFAYNLAKDRPLVGGGFEAYNKEIFRRYAPDPEDFHDAHSIYFEMLAEHGFMGLLLFLMVGALALRTGTWVVANTRHHPDLKWAGDLAALVRVSLIGYAVGGTFLGLAYFDLYYHLVAVALLLRAVVAQQLATRTSTAAFEPPPADLAVEQRQAS